MHKYAQPDEIYNGEIGTLHGVRFVETSEAKIWKDTTCPSGLAVFGTLVLGAHAYGVTELEGGGLEHIVKQLGYGDDPLNQRAPWAGRGCAPPSVWWSSTWCALRAYPATRRMRARTEPLRRFAPAPPSRGALGKPGKPCWMNETRRGVKGSAPATEGRKDEKWTRKT